jgi:predicted amidophosphoribosyltransferase
MGFINIIVDGLLPRICKCCYKPIYYNNYLDGICVFCSLQWSVFPDIKSSRLLFYERFNGINYYAVGFRLNDEGSKSIIHRCKYSGNPQLILQLGVWMAKRWPAPDSNIVLVPIPLHPLRRLRRGYNQAEKFAMGLSEVWDLEVDTKVLIRKIHSASLTGSNRSGRAEVLRNVFDTGESSGDNPIILIDDVLTTGATLRACREVIEASGRRVVGAVVLALA